MPVDDQPSAHPTEPQIPPALTPGQWTGVLSNAGQLMALRESFGGIPFSSHALAALFLFEQSFGFTHEDVIDEREVAAYCDVMAAHHEAEGDAKKAAAFQELAGRHRVRAAKIAALLPPEGMTPAETRPAPR